MTTKRRSKKARKPMLNSKQVKEMVEEKIKGFIPPWVRGYSMAGAGWFATNALTGKEYQGMNQMVGMCVASELGGNLFATAKQWFKLAKRVKYFDKYKGGKILRRDAEENTVAPVADFFLRKPTKSALKEGHECPPEWVVVEGGREYRKGILWRSFSVYHETQVAPELVEMVKAKYYAPKDHAEIVEIEEMVAALAPKMGTGKPSYVPSLDTIRMPPMDSYDTPERYYDHLIHEVGHWTGAATRLDRDGIRRVSFGSGVYSYEECIAEWVSLIGNAHFGIIANEEDTTNSAAYIQHWSERIAAHPNLLTDTFKEAEKAWKWLKEHGKVTEAQNLLDSDEEAAA